MNFKIFIFLGMHFQGTTAHGGVHTNTQTQFNSRFQNARQIHSHNSDHE